MKKPFSSSHPLPPETMLHIASLMFICPAILKKREGEAKDLIVSVVHPHPLIYRVPHTPFPVFM